MTVKTDDVKTLGAAARFRYWVTERESVRLKRAAGEPAPWTDDEVLRTYRFCNVRRMDDKVSQWLLTNWYLPFKGHRNMLAATALARFVNKPESLGDVTDLVFRDRGKGPDWIAVKANLRMAKEKYGTTFNAAYMVRGNTKTSPDKVGTVVDEYVRPAVEKFADGFQTDNMESLHDFLQECYGFGSFMAGQVVADLRWATPGEWADAKTWAPVGPGSARGMARLLGGDLEKDGRAFAANPATWLLTFREHVLGAAAKTVPRAVRDRLEAMDWQNCLCEFDKYERALWGEGKPKQLYRGAV